MSTPDKSTPNGCLIGWVPFVYQNHSLSVSAAHLEVGRGLVNALIIEHRANIGDNLQQIFAGWWFGTCFIFSYIGNFIIPTDYYFSEGLKPPTRFGFYIYTYNHSKHVDSIIPK